MTILASYMEVAAKRWLHGLSKEMWSMEDALLKAADLTLAAIDEIYPASKLDKDVSRNETSLYVTSLLKSNGLRGMPEWKSTAI